MSFKNNTNKQEHDDHLGGSSSSSSLSSGKNMSFNLRNVSKLILPPLGVSSNKYENPVESIKGRIISPMDSRYRCWESLMVVLVAYSAWVYPFEVAFMHSSPPQYRRIYIVDTLVDLFFAVDIVLTFFLAYIDRTTHLLVHDSKKIVLRVGCIAQVA
ncbi:RAC-beta serine/threonine-protein kinase [Stylosanthes scabra]|uniref:RAC-beta serine/threonine-protein kinase n=1 Tax=Stylosanthes scabra TaxID=79078 RepID=A0ABU6T5E2_9FABA|nr:RAC-beta serine/threonine-protein kinase [Stylosanthes scabra]